jgi:hypothetical protein
MEFILSYYEREARRETWTAIALAALAVMQAVYIVPLLVDPVKSK